MQVSTSVSAGARSQGDKKHPVFPVGHMVLFSLVTVLFFLWGMSNNLTDILVQQFRKSFELSTFSAQLVSTANFTGYFVMAMDETLAICAVDLSGRVAYVVDDQVTVPVVGDLQTELVADFFDGFARGAKANVHVKTMYGRSNHHKIEAIFKAFARAMRGACSRDERMRELLPSTKGLL